MQELSTTHWRRLAIAVAALTLVLIGGTIGYVVLGFSPLNALYQSVTTVSTVGFREVEPLGRAGKIFTMLLILVGVGTTLYAFGMLIETILEGRIQDLMGRRRMQRTINELSGHVVVCGWGRVGRSIAHDLFASGQELVVIDRDAERLRDCPYPIVVGDATEDPVLEEAGLQRATALVAGVETDAGNLYITISARALAPHLFIVARARSEASEPKLRRVGADRVVNPQHIGGTRMAAFVLQPNVAEFIDVVMHDSGLEFRLAEVEVGDASSLAGSTLREAHVRHETGAMVLALRGDTGFITNPPPDTVISPGHVLIAIGTSEQLDRLGALVDHGSAATP